MSETASLPGYPHAPAFERTPSYSAEPARFEQRLALVEHGRPSGSFTKQSKSGGLSLTLEGQEDDAAVPVYGIGAVVEGSVNLTKTDGVSSVEIKLEGVLNLKEIAEGGTVSHSLCLDRHTLWSKARDPGPCPSSLSFSLPLPSTFSDEKTSYPLPPTYAVHLSGVPGFRANIDYSVKVTVSKGNPALKRASIFGLDLGNTTVSTSFTYAPRTRPAAPLPSPLVCLPESHGFAESAEWAPFESAMRAKVAGGQDIVARLLLPRSRIFCAGAPVPFHLAFVSSALSLAAFLPFAPAAPATKQSTKIQLVRQSSVDVRNEVVMGTKTDMWRTDVIGEGTFTRAGDGADWLAFSGRIPVSDQIKMGGFRAGGLNVKDYIVLSMTPSEPSKAPFRELRLIVPVRLTTDAWSKDGSGVGYAGSNFSVPSDPDEYDGAVPELPRQ